MKLLKMNYLLWKREREAYKKRRIDRHMLKMYYLKVDEAITKCKTHPRKYYLVQKSESEWEILGSQELRKMRKFSEAKHDETFMQLHETAPYISPENLARWEHEQKRRRNKWWFLFSENYYKPITKDELSTLKVAQVKCQSLGFTELSNELTALIEKHA